MKEKTSLEKKKKRQAFVAFLFCCAEVKGPSLANEKEKREKEKERKTFAFSSSGLVFIFGFSWG